MAILTPAILLLVFGVIQAALFFTARNVVSSAAQVGLDAVRVENGTINAGTTAARTYVDQVGGTTGLNVSGGRDATTASVTVSVDPPVLLPGLPLPRITASAVAPVEQFLP